MKRRMLKLGSLAVCAAMALSLASCTSTPQTSTPPSGEPTPAVSATPAPTQGQAAAVTAGTYTGTAIGFEEGEVIVDVTVDADGKITDLQVNATSQTKNIGQAAAPDMAQNILDSQRLDCDTVTGATYTCLAILEAAESALTQAGVDVSALKAGDTAPAPTEAEEVTVDVAVVGAGASGTAAAAAAIRGGASVLMVEKTGDVGGISKYFAGGPFAVQSHLQQEAGGDYAAITEADLLQAINDYARHINYGPLTKAVVCKSGDTISWLEDMGVTFHVNGDPAQISDIGKPIQYMLYHWYDLFTYDYKPGDKAAIDVVHDYLLENGLDRRFKTTCTGLLQEADGTVNGIVCTKEDGGQLIVHAKAVVLGTGGFAGNAEMMDEYYRMDAEGSWGEDGAGIQMAWDAGAAKWDTSSSLFHGAGMVGPTTPGDIDVGSSAFSRIPRSPLMWIDQSGNRFCNEEVVWDVALTAAAAYSVGGTYYILVDTNTLNGYTENKTLRIDTAVGGPNWEDGDFVALAEEGVKQGMITKGETLEDLAAALDMDYDRLSANVAEYNTAVETKTDIYGKTAESLMYGVSEGPFYAIKCQIGNLGTLGGVRVNEKLQACDRDLRPIPGLYVVGNDAGGFYGNTTTYPPYGGLATGFAWNSGRIAGESAAAEIKGQ